ncbi:MAG TPA: hypothetical protein VMB71_09025 [Acetobacteraceae bacterium]|nr:hypothetical protein [Acetobacteraceae bacterium]
MDEPGTIASYYRLDAARPPHMVGGLRAFAASDRRDPARPLIAVQARPDLPPRARALARTAQAQVPHAMLPLDQGPGRDPAGHEVWFMLCAAPPGPALSATPGVWSEDEVMRCLLAPAAAALDALSARGVTHRAIRPDNLFRAGPGEAVMLGPFWAAPPASLQPSAFEPAYSAMCQPAGRGEGTVADDVYALGVTMLWCVLGAPAAWADGAALLARQLDIGSFAALVGSAPLSPGLVELLRLMLAEEPDHRPSPAALMAPDQARARRLATRPPMRAQRPLLVGNREAYTARSLAHALACEPEHGAAIVADGSLDRWLRRMLGNAQLAVRLEEMVVAVARELDRDDGRKPAALVMRAVCVLDPLAPLAWRGAILFPDGLGSALVTAESGGQTALRAALEHLVTHDAIAHWSALQTKRRDLAGMRQESLEWRSWLGTRGPMGGMRRLLYGLNPLLPCGSPLLAGRTVARLGDLLPALEQAAQRADRKRPPIDPHIAAFIAARADTALSAEMGQLDGFVSPAERLAVLRLFARLQARLHLAPLPLLAGWLLESGLIELTAWRNLHTRKALAARLAEAAAAGQIATMLLLAQDEQARQADHAGAERAVARAAAIETELAALAADGPARHARAEKLGQDIAGGAGLVATLTAAMALGLGL